MAVISGTQGNDWLSLDRGNDTVLLTGLAGDDTVSFDDNDHTGFVTVAGNLGDDSIITDSQENIRFFGGEGIDTLVWTGAFETLDIRGLLKGIERISSATDFDTITGSARGETLEGAEGTGTHHLYGRGGSDYLKSIGGLVDGGGGNDTLVSDGADMRGGRGNDVFVFPESDPLVDIWDFGEGDLLDLRDRALSFDDLAIGWRRGDLMITAPDGASVILHGLNPPEYFTVEDVILGPRVPETVLGTAGDDLIKRWEGDWRITGADGNDTISVRGGTSTVWGQAGDDVLRTTSLVGSKFFGGDGYDTFEWTGTSPLLLDVVRGPDGTLRSVEKIVAGLSEAQIRGSNHGETIVGGDGFDGLFGRGGDDSIDGGGGSDNLRGGGGNDTLCTEDGTVYGRIGDDRIEATDYAYLYGNRGNDTLVSYSYAGEVSGGAGNDALFLTAEGKKVNGGSGSDTLAVFTTYLPLGPGVIHFQDFEDGIDKLDLSAWYETFEEVVAKARETVTGHLVIDLDADGIAKTLDLTPIRPFQLTPDDVIL